MKCELCKVSKAVFENPNVCKECMVVYVLNQIADLINSKLDKMEAKLSSLENTIKNISSSSQ